MSETTINPAIAFAIKEKKIDLLAFTKANPNQEYYKFYEQRKLLKPVYRSRNLWVLNLSDITDLVLLERIVNFMWDSMNPNRRSPLIYHTNVVMRIDDILNYVSCNAKANYATFLEETADSNTTTLFIKARECCHRFHRFCIDKDYANNPFAADIWNLDLMQLAPERKDVSVHHSRLYFIKILNVENRELVKKYIKHLILNTDNTVNTLYSKLMFVANSLNLIDKPYTQWEKSDADRLVEIKQNHRIKRNTIGAYIRCMEDFTEFLLMNNFMEDSAIKHLHNLSNTLYEYKATAKDNYVITQIFNILGKIEDAALTICFLLIYCTGMRVSEACGMLKNCLDTDGENYFVRFYQVKMKKDVINVIPKALYDLIADYRKELPSVTKYLFPGQRVVNPRQQTTFVGNIKEALAPFEIKNSDGTSYDFSAHSFRHLMAVRMREEDIPFQFIQAQLHHESPEMTLAYTEFLDRQKVAKMKSFINIHGEVSPITTEIKLTDDEAYADYMRQFINSQVLTNGVCARPVKLGKCPHCNACLKCKDFRTSIEFLEIHETHFQRTEKYISYAEENGWIIQARESRDTKASLQKIINALKELEDKNV